LSVVDKIPKNLLFQPSFRHLTTNVQVYEGDMDKIVNEYGVKGKDAERLKVRAGCAMNWLEKYAPEEMKFKIVSKAKISGKDKETILKVIEKVGKGSDKELHEEIYTICKESGYEPKDFFKMFYNALVKKDKGPRLASFLLTIGKVRLVKIFS